MSRKFNFSAIFKCLLSAQLLWVQTTFAAEKNYAAAGKLAMISSLPNMQAVLDVVGSQMPKEDLVGVEAQLKKAGVDLNQKLPLTYKNGSLYYGHDEIKMTKNGVNYKGMNFKYNTSKSFSQNFELFSDKINGKESFSKFSLFVNSAHAVVSAAAAGLAISVLITFAASVQIYEAVAVAGTFAAFGFFGKMVYDDYKKQNAYLEVKEFKCLPNGWTLKTVEGVTVNGTELSSGDIQVEVIKKDGSKSVKPIVGALKDSFLYTKEVCAKGDNKMAEIISKKYIPKTAPTQSPQKSQNAEGVK